MGIEKSDFPELEGMETDDEETSEEETREEKEVGDSNLNFGTNEEGSEYTEQWSEQDKQLRREEREAEDDWWFS